MKNTHRLHASAKRRRQVYIKKLLLCVTSLIIVACLSIAVGCNFAAAHDNSENTPVEHKYYKSIEIQAGDTLWDIAEEYMNDEYSSVYDYIWELKEMNQLESDHIHEGQYLTVAYYDTEFH